MPDQPIDPPCPFDVCPLRSRVGPDAAYDSERDLWLAIEAGDMPAVVGNLYGQFRSPARPGSTVPSRKGPRHRSGVPYSGTDEGREYSAPPGRQLREGLQ